MNKDVKIVVIIGSIVAAILIVVPLVWGGPSGWSGGWGMMGPGMMGSFGIMGGLMGVGMVLFWGLVIWGIVALARGGVQTNNGSFSQGDSALEILKRRYARGEITKQEYEERKKDLV